MKKKMVLTMVAVFCVAVFGMSSANADFIPNDIGNTASFLNDSTYFNGMATAVNTPKTFEGEWQYTAIAYESGNINITNNDNDYSDGTVTFTTDDLRNWGTWVDVNFASGNIYFTDKVDGPINVAFNPYEDEEDTARFQVYQLKDGSKLLSYLSNPLTLSAGTYIIGWNDNLADQANDSDYDDIIIAMRPKMPVPEPASMLLLGLGLVGLAGLSRRFKK